MTKLTPQDIEVLNKVVHRKGSKYKTWEQFKADEKGWAIEAPERTAIVARQTETERCLEVVEAICKESKASPDSCNEECNNCWINELKARLRGKEE